MLYTHNIYIVENFYLVSWHTNFDKTKEPKSVRREGNNSSTPTAHTPTSTRRMRDSGSSTSNIPPEGA